MCKAYYLTGNYAPMLFSSRKEAMRVCAELGLTGCMYYVSCFDK